MRRRPPGSATIFSRGTSMELMLLRFRWTSYPASPSPPAATRTEKRVGIVIPEPSVSGSLWREEVGDTLVDGIIHPAGGTVQGPFKDFFCIFCINFERKIPFAYRAAEDIHQ